MPSHRRRLLAAALVTILCSFTAVSANAAGDTQPPSTPANFQATAVSGNTIAVAWDPAHDNFGLVGYHVSLDVAHHSADTGNRTTQGFDDLRPGTRYHATLSTFDGRGNRSPDVHLDVTTATIDGTAPTAPASLRPVFVNGTLHSIAWDASAHNQSVIYKVYTSNLGRITSTNETRLRIWDLVFSDCILNPGSTYDVTVVAQDGPGHVSDSSNVLRITLPTSPIR